MATETPDQWNNRYLEDEAPWDSGQASDEMLQVFSEYSIRPCRTLEIGCGTGTNAISLAQQGFEVTAVDVAPVAIERAKQKAQAEGVEVDFRVVDLLEAGVAEGLTSGEPYSLVFDRGVYHVLRRIGLDAFLKMIAQVVAPGGTYILLAGNANEADPKEGGPPMVHAHELAGELAPLFDLVQLREFRFGGVELEGEAVSPLAWSAVLRRKSS